MLRFQTQAILEQYHRKGLLQQLTLKGQYFQNLITEKLELHFTSLETAQQRLLHMYLLLPLIHKCNFYPVSVDVELSVHCTCVLTRRMD